jgi:cobalt-zinc-cadmium efflux system outer membrane protein
MPERPTALVAILMAGAATVCSLSASALAADLTMDEAVGIALKRNRDVIAARLEIDVAQLDVVAARIYPNPILAYGIGNLVVGKGNPQDEMHPLHPGFLSQPVQSVGVSDVIDIWAKRSARTRAADRGVGLRRLLTEDLLREIVYEVRSAFAALAREQSENRLAVETAERYAETVRLSQSRFRAGDISEAELRKVELEGLRYKNAVIDADLELDLARQNLAALLGYSSAAELPAITVRMPETRQSYDLEALVALAFARRPDVKATAAARGLAEAQLAAAKREIFPDVVLGANYTHSDFTVSGDNPNALGLTLSLPLPLFDRNQANVGRSSLEIRRADNETERLKVLVRHQVADAVRKAARSRTLLEVFEGPSDGDGAGLAKGGLAAGGASTSAGLGGMLDRAETSLRVAERSYKAGAISLLELLEAQRTYLETRGEYLRALHDYRQAAIDVGHAVGEEVK